MKKTCKQDFWFDHITRCQSSSLTQKEYCKQESLNFNTFVFWRMKFINKQDDKALKKKSISFIPAIIKEANLMHSSVPNTIQIDLPNQVKVMVPSNLSIDILAAFVRTLGGLS